MGTVVLAGATSGSTTLTPVDAVTATITLPSVTGTLATLGANTFVGNQAVTGTLSATGVTTLARIAATAAAGSQHTLSAAYTDDVALIITNTQASNPYGMNVSFSAADPNDATRWFFRCIGNGTERATTRSNGGLANYSANNVNLSDMRTKDVFEDYTPEMLDELEAKFIAIRRGRFKYNDQTHGDWNYGKSAQSVAEQLPELAGIWNETKVVDGLIVPTLESEQLLCEYSHDITQIGEALLVRALKRIEALEARVAALEAK